MPGGSRGRFRDFRIRMRRAEQALELSRDISERRLGLDQPGSVAISRVVHKTMGGVLASIERLQMAGSKCAHGHREQLLPELSHLFVQSAVGQRVYGSGVSRKS